MLWSLATRRYGAELQGAHIMERVVEFLRALDIQDETKALSRQGFLLCDQVDDYYSRGPGEATA